jgi:hypothetical protein
MTFETIAHIDPFRAQRGGPISKIGRPGQKNKKCLRHLVLPVITLLLATSACRQSDANDAPLPVFDGVTTEFTLTRSQIKKDQPLEVRAIVRNTTNTIKAFRFLDFDVNARLYANGQLLEDRCDEGLDFPFHVITLKPGETSEGTTKVLTPLCYKLAPGQYSIRFNYNLRALEDESLRADYEKKYGHPDGGIVPWDGRDHPFTVVE